ncbi:MAG TPA: hypothetical protein VFQ72_02800 [Candidatus Paceibacterota bacterium]|nr:hypothetical protein [Candidatus Paceibacterota bacterium]
MFDKDSLHHAYFIEGDRAATLAALETFLKEAFGILRHGHPDVHYAEHESLGIDESRALQVMQAVRPVMGDRKVFILAVDGMTNEAQNSLLKVFEEPTPGTHFFVIARSRRMLLPTLASRMVVVRHESAPAENREAAARAFIEMPYKDRLAYVAVMVEDKDKAAAEGFLAALMAELHTRGKIKAVREILPLLGYIKDRSSSLKLILERAALLHL